MNRKSSREQNFLAEIPTRKKKMILLVAILAFGGLAIDAETTPDYGEDYWYTAMAATTLDPWRKLIGASRREQFDKTRHD